MKLAVNSTERKLRQSASAAPRVPKSLTWKGSPRGTTKSTPTAVASVSAATMWKAAGQPKV